MGWYEERWETVGEQGNESLFQRCTVARLQAAQVGVESAAGAMSAFLEAVELRPVSCSARASFHRRIRIEAQASQSRGEGSARAVVGAPSAFK